MSYIKTGSMSKLLSSPKPIFSAALLELQEEVDRMHEIYDRLRCSDGRTWMPAPLTDEAREVRKKLAAAQKRYNEAFDAANPEYVKHWRG